MEGEVKEMGLLGGRVPDMNCNGDQGVTAVDARGGFPHPHLLTQ